MQLYDGHFLLAVGGRSNSKKGIWFYVSNQTVIDETTTWRFINYWVPACTTEDKEHMDECFAGASGMALLTDCSGAIYLTTMHGSQTGFLGGYNYQWIQVYRIAQEPTGNVKLEWSSWQRDNTGLSQLNNPAFRWAGGAYMTSDGLPVLFNTERRTNEGDNDFVDGHLYFRTTNQRQHNALLPRGALADPPLTDPDGVVDSALNHEFNEDQ